MSTLNEWGPAMWHSMHIVSFGLDAQAKYDFYASLPRVLPCKDCGNHLAQLYKLFPIDVSSPRACSVWVWQLHNQVNTSLGKKVLFTYLDLLYKYLPVDQWEMFGITDNEARDLARKPKLNSKCEWKGFKVGLFVCIIVIIAIVWKIV